MADDLLIGQIGIGIKHDKGFAIDRPSGSGDVVFLHFMTPIRLLSRSGRRVEKAGACILYTPPHPQWYTADGAHFSHDWFHLAGRDAVSTLRRAGLPQNTVFHPRETAFIAGDLAAVQREVWHREPHWSEAVALRLELFLLRLGRAARPDDDGTVTAYKADLRRTFQALRAKIHGDPARAWDIAAMAREVHLSPSRFAVLYREFFGTTPAQELIRARLDKAAWLLTSTALPVAEVAAICGFNSLPYFSRLFHRRLHRTPRDYSRRTPQESA